VSRDAPALIPIGGEQPEELLLRSQIAGWDEHWPSDWSSKGIVYDSGSDRFDTDLWILPGAGFFSVSAGGRQFLMPVDDDSGASIIVVTNWPATLKP
jgi:hypothetical protein